MLLSRRICALLILPIGLGAMLISQTASARGHGKAVKNLNGVIDHLGLTSGLETIGGASIQDAIAELRERADFPINFEMIEFQRPAGFVTLGEALATLHAMQTAGTLGERDKTRLDRYELMAQTHESSEILVPRQRTFSLVRDQVTVRDLLDQLVTLDDEYFWKNYGTESRPLVVIQPCASTALGWSISPICAPRPISIDELLASCSGQECGPFTRLLSDHSTSVIDTYIGPASASGKRTYFRSHGSVDLCADHLTARDVLDFTAKATKSSWTLAGVKGMRFLSFDTSTR